MLETVDQFIDTYLRKNTLDMLRFDNQDNKILIEIDRILTMNTEPLTCSDIELSVYAISTITSTLVHNYAATPAQLNTLRVIKFDAAVLMDNPEVSYEMMDYFENNPPNLHAKEFENQRIEGLYHLNYGILLSRCERFESALGEFNRAIDCFDSIEDFDELYRVYANRLRQHTFYDPDMVSAAHDETSLDRLSPAVGMMFYKFLRQDSSAYQYGLLGQNDKAKAHWDKANQIIEKNQTLFNSLRPILPYHQTRELPTEEESAAFRKNYKI